MFFVTNKLASNHESASLKVLFFNALGTGCLDEVSNRYASTNCMYDWSGVFPNLYQDAVNKLNIRNIAMIYIYTVKH